jgi:hypothetical protein
MFVSIEALSLYASPERWAQFTFKNSTHNAFSLRVMQSQAAMGARRKPDLQNSNFMCAAASPPIVFLGAGQDYINTSPEP